LLLSPVTYVAGQVRNERRGSIHEEERVPGDDLGNIEQNRDYATNIN
jgi:hypothetical protein